MNQEIRNEINLLIDDIVYDVSKGITCLDKENYINSIIDLFAQQSSRQGEKYQASFNSNLEKADRIRELRQQLEGLNILESALKKIVLGKPVHGEHPYRDIAGEALKQF